MFFLFPSALADITIIAHLLDVSIPLRTFLLLFFWGGGRVRGVGGLWVRGGFFGELGKPISLAGARVIVANCAAVLAALLDAYQA